MQKIATDFADYTDQKKYSAKRISQIYFLQAKNIDFTDRSLINTQKK
jgi:hypothetical protein